MDLRTPEIKKAVAKRFPMRPMSAPHRSKDMSTPSQVMPRKRPPSAKTAETDAFSFVDFRLSHDDGEEREGRELSISPNRSIGGTPSEASPFRGGGMGGMGGMGGGGGGGSGGSGEVGGGVGSDGRGEGEGARGEGKGWGKASSMRDRPGSARTSYDQKRKSKLVYFPRPDSPLNFVGVKGRHPASVAHLMYIEDLGIVSKCPEREDLPEAAGTHLRVHSRPKSAPINSGSRMKRLSSKFSEKRDTSPDRDRERGAGGGGGGMGGGMGGGGRYGGTDSRPGTAIGLSARRQRSPTYGSPRQGSPRVGSPRMGSPRPGTAGSWGGANVMTLDRDRPATSSSYTRYSTPRFAMDRPGTAGSFGGSFGGSVSASTYSRYSTPAFSVTGMERPSTASGFRMPTRITVSDRPSTAIGLGIIGRSTSSRPGTAPTTRAKRETNVRLMDD